MNSYLSTPTEYNLITWQDLRDFPPIYAKMAESASRLLMQAELLYREISKHCQGIKLDSVLTRTSTQLLLDMDAQLPTL